MQKTRLLHALVVCGPALTGGSIAVVAVAGVASIAGCDNESYGIIDMGQLVDMADGARDIGQYAIIDY